MDALRVGAVPLRSGTRMRVAPVFTPNSVDEAAAALCGGPSVGDASVNQI